MIDLFVGAGRVWEVRQGDALDVLREIPACSIDAVVTDPPYGLGFMGKDWDSPGGTGDFPMRRTTEANTVNTGVSRQGGRQRSCADFAKRQARDAQSFEERQRPWVEEALRVLKPGGHLLAFGGTRTFHRLTCAIEDAGFEIRDCLSWLYGSGFPKSLDVSKAIDKAAGHWRGRAGAKVRSDQPSKGDEYERNPKEPPVTVAAAAAAALQGLGTALKPAWEPIILARKPLIGTVAANVMEHGTGALMIDPCRISTNDRLGGGAEKDRQSERPEGWDRPWRHDPEAQAAHAARIRGNVERAESLGRWPANLVLDEEAARMLDEQSGELVGGNYPARRQGIGYTKTAGRTNSGTVGHARTMDLGGASRFFYTAKASSGERHYTGRNAHPTVKPVDLMRWLVRLVTPPGGLVLDPFCGSGSTGIAALAEGFRFLGIERVAEYVELARRRIAGPLFAEAPA